MSNFQKSFKLSYIKYFMTIDIEKNGSIKMFITIKFFWTFLKIIKKLPDILKKYILL
jgi:hypothetical protein